MSLSSLRAEVFERDGGCVWPDCDEEITGINPLQLAHIQHRGMGGSKSRNNPDNCVTLCRIHHDVYDGRTSLGTSRWEIGRMLLKQAGIAVLLCALALPAWAHDTSQLDAWVEEWQSRRPWSITDIDEWIDMADRHPDYFEYSEPRERTLPSKPAPRGSGTVEQWRGLVASHFPASQVNTALCIMHHESRGDPRAKNPRSSARGLFQILASLWAPHYGVSYEALYDPSTNTRIAADIWRNYGWWAWSPYKRGECRS